MEKQTAVEWLVEKFDLTSDSPIIKNVVEQAKEMEKEQIIDAYAQGYNNAYFNNPLSKEQYYQETFKKD
jgi:hypothetical protein